MYQLRYRLFLLLVCFAVFVSFMSGVVALSSTSELYAATDLGIYMYDGNQDEWLKTTITEDTVKRIMIDNDIIYYITEAGLFWHSLSE